MHNVKFIMYSFIMCSFKVHKSISFDFFPNKRLSLWGRQHYFNEPINTVRQKDKSPQAPLCTQSLHNQVISQFWGAQLRVKICEMTSQQYDYKQMLTAGTVPISLGLFYILAISFKKSFWSRRIMIRKNYAKVILSNYNWRTHLEMSFSLSRC